MNVRLRIEIAKSRLESLKGYLAGTVSSVGAGQVIVLALDDRNPSVCDVYEVDSSGALKPFSRASLIAAIFTGSTADAETMREYIKSVMTFVL